MIFISLLLITVLVFFLIHVYAKDDNISDFATEIYAYAGGVQTKPPIPVFELTNEYIFHIGKEAYSSHHKDMQVIRVFGDSVKQFKGNISDGDRALADKSIKVEQLVAGDIVLLCKTKPNGNKFYKLRSFLKLEEGIVLCSQTVKKDEKKSEAVKSYHKLGMIDESGDIHTYVGKIIAKEKSFYKNIL